MAKAEGVTNNSTWCSSQPEKIILSKINFDKNIYGALAQLARAPALQAGGPGFESPTLHHILNDKGD